MNYQNLFKDQNRRFWSMLYLGVLSLLFLAAVSGNEKPIWAATGPTIINIGTTIQHEDVKRLGINVSGQLSYDSAQMLRDITFNNPGFESQMWQSVLTCAAVSGNTCTDANGWSQWPANFLQGGSFEFIYGSVKGKTGTLVSMTKASGNGGAGGWYNFGNVNPAVGDIFIVKKNFPGDPAAGWWPSTSGGGTITAETSDLSPHTAGKQALVFNTNGSGQSASVHSYFDSTAGRSFLQMKGSYTLTFRAKSASGSKTLGVEVGRFTSTHGNATYFNQQVPLTNQWQDFTFNFNADEDGTYIGTAFLGFSATGGTIYLDDASLTESAEASNKSPFRDAVVDRLKELNPGVLRYMDSGVSFGTSIDNMIAVPDARLRTGFGQGSSETNAVPMGLEEFLQLCETVGAEPWYTLPMGVSPEETQHLVQFLAGDSSTPYGAKRAALGQLTPWTSVFPKIHLELGDESWNTAFSGDAIVAPTAYGSRVATIFGAARSASGYEESKFDLIMDGWAAVPWWNQQAMNAASNSYDTIDVAPYTFDTFTDYSSNTAIFGSMLAQPEAIDSRPTGSMYQQMQTVSGQASGLSGKPANLAVYEVNLSTTTGTAPQSVINEVVPSLGAGLSTAEHMLLMMRDDNVQMQTMFALPGYQNGYTNTHGGGGNVQLWGTVIDMGGQSDLCRPQFLAETLANTAIGGNMIATTQTGADPTWNEASANDNANPIIIKGAHYIQSFAFVNGTQNSLVLFNLNLTSALPVTFTGTNAPSGEVQVGVLNAANLTDTNESGAKVAITHSTMAGFNPGSTINLPAHSMTVYTWSTAGGVTPPKGVPTTTSLSATPTSVSKGKTVGLVARVIPKTGSSLPSGNIVFKDGSSTLGTTTLSDGSVSLNVTTLAAGTHTITANYVGSTAYEASVSPAVVVKVASSTPLITTSTKLTAPAQVDDGRSLALSAVVARSSGATPTGTATFYAGSTRLGSANLSGGKASLTVSDVTLAAATYGVYATYSGNSTDASSRSNTVNVKVERATPLIATSTKLTAPSQVDDGKSLALSAVVAKISGATPTGTATFFAGSTKLGSANLSGGKATLTVKDVTLASATYGVYATYSGSNADASSRSNTVNMKVVNTAYATKTAVALSSTKVKNGQKVTAKVTVAASSGAVPTGSVKIYLGSSVLATLSLSKGTATYSTTATKTGSYQTYAVYTGSSTDTSSTSAKETLTVGS